MKMLCSILLDDQVLFDSSNKAPSAIYKGENSKTKDTIAVKQHKKIDEPSQSSDDEKVVDAFSSDSSQRNMDGLEEDIFERGDTLGKSNADATNFLKMTV